MPRVPPLPRISVQALISRLPTHLVVGRRPALWIAAAGLGTVMWAAAATWYIAARDDIAQHIFVRDTDLQYGYEDRIKVLQAELERALTQNLVERNGFTARVDRLASRQAEIEGHQSWLKTLAERGLGGELRVTSGGMPLPKPFDPDTTSSISPQQAKPTPLPDSFSIRRETEPEPAGKPRARDRLSALEQALDGAAAEQIGIVEGLRRSAQERLARWRIALGSTGLDVDRFLSGSRAAGGPLVPLPSPAKAGAFGPLAAELEATVSELDRVQSAARALPLGRPVSGEIDPTSGFGYRMDPFTRGPALHTGLDLRAEAGSLVRATAAGRVTIAEYTGGYGNLVEIDHGNGLATRYGHLSGFLVAPGDRVEAGEMVGRAGSTGRSTGSHLHYETRINGEPVDPARFLAAGAKLASLSNTAR
jgi:murein DD-endopeptidase MepM/ murein hydrolase activator NlpD